MNRGISPVGTTAAQPAGVDNPLLHRPERRPVELRAYGVRADGGVVDMRVLDLCYDGCRVEGDSRLEPGEEIKLSVLGRGALKAHVRWSDGRRAGLQFDLQIAPRQHPRKSERVALAAEVFVRRAGKTGYRVTMHDLSPVGCRCDFVERPPIGEHVWVKFDGLEALESKVCWLEGSMLGLKFQRPMHPAVFDLLLQRLA